MSTAITISSGTVRADAPPLARPFVLATSSVAVAACLLAGFVPLGFSIVTVFIFAGPHNWMEARYFLARMPARWGALTTYFSAGLGGVIVLTGTFAALPWFGRLGRWDREAWLIGIAAWNTALVLWVLLLVRMRSRQNPRRDWGWVAPAGFAVIACAWLWPMAWDLALVYIHPLVALWFLDCELGARRPEWQAVYRRLLVLVPLCLGLLWWRLAEAPNLPGDDALSARIANHAGANLLSGVSSHFLVAAHTFLEMLHYGAWLVAIPLVAIGTVPWRIGRLPLARRSVRWRRLVAAILLVGLAAVVVLWAGFLANYPLTRDIYFTVAMLHVLAEAPFLLRQL